jgi:2-keto-4-pentenoate hydratase/2-oxohepta-3-ene-1,7-dioic acid hydratase in catechol pathway
VNDVLRQNGNTDDLIFKIPRIVSEISQVVTLLPGDVILTGTPAGVGRLTPGDTVRVEIDGIGVLENPVIDRNA